MDWLGGLLVAFGIVGVNLALSLGAEPLTATLTLDATTASAGSPLLPYRWWLLLGSVVSLAGFGLVERRATAPLIPPALWRPAGFVAAAAINLLLGAALIVAMVNVPVLVNTGLGDVGQAQWRSAWLLTPLTLGLAGGLLGGGWLSGRLAGRWVAIAGLGLAAATFWDVSRQSVTMALPSRVPPLIALGVGVGLVIASSASIAMATARASDRGVVAGLVLVMRLLGMALDYQP